MKFSVIIPIYNADAFLERCLKSVADQEYKDFEVIMVNDGSTDNSEAICLKYKAKDHRFRYYPQANGGVSAARNTGIKLAAGDYITFLDSDDAYYPTYLSEFVRMMEQYPDVGHFWCAFAEYDKNGVPSGKVYQIKSDNIISVLSRDDIMYLHQHTMDGSPWNKVYKKSLLNGILMRPGLSLGEDMIFNWEYLDKNPCTQIVINNIPQYGYYQMSDDSLDHRYRSNLKDIYDELIAVMKHFLTKWNASPEQWKLLYTTSFFLYEQVLRNTFRNENTVSAKAKYQFNDLIMRSDCFKEALKEMNGKLNPIYYYAYKTGKYKTVVFCDWLVEQKHGKRTKM